MLFYHLNVHQLYANISTDNTASIALLLNLVLSALLKDWNLINGSYQDEAMYQLIK
jgi:diamine N-acetyltransferase